MAKEKIKKQSKAKIAQKILIPLTTVAVVGGLALTISLKHEDIRSWFNKQKTYSYDEVQEMLNEKDSAWENKMKNLIENSNYLKKQFDEVTKAKLESDSKIANLENQIEVSNAEHQAKIAELQNTIDTNSEEYQTALNQLNAEHAQEIETLQSQLESEKNNNSDLSSQIENLNSQIVELNQKIAMYEDLIQQYENDQTAPVSFYDGETLIKATLVSKGSTYSLDENLIPANSETREFIGWAVDGLEVDSDTFVINTATVFTAVFKYKVNYVINGETTSLMIKQGTALSENAPEVTPGSNQEFAGWIDENGQAVDLTSTNVVAPITLTAQFNTVYNITFNYDDISTTIRLVNGEFEETIPTPTKTGYGLAGWIDSSGTKVSLSNLKNLTADTVLTPEFIELFQITIAYRIGTGNYTNYSTKIYTILGSKTQQYLVESDLMKVIYEIQNLTGKTASGNCISLSSSTDPYLTLKKLTVSSVPPMSYSSDTTIYITLN